MGVTTILGWIWYCFTWTLVKIFNLAGYIIAFSLFTILFFFILPMLIFLALWKLGLLWDTNSVTSGSERPN